MKRRSLLVLAAMSLMVVLCAGFVTSSSATTLTGTATLDNRAASAVVIAMPYDSLTNELVEAKAVVMPTDATGAFRLNVPDGKYLLIAWDGRNGAVLDSPTGSVALHLTKQAPPSYQVAADCTYTCQCRHIIGNLYIVWLSSNSWTCGSYQYISWGCRC